MKLLTLDSRLGGGGDRGFVASQAIDDHLRGWGGEGGGLGRGGKGRGGVRRGGEKVGDRGVAFVVASG